MSNPIEQTIRNDFSFVRNDITELKKCQLQYFVLSITGTSAILSISNYFKDANNINYLIPLIPLLIVLPCWWIFFDKAHSISRNTGYIQILEEILIDNIKGNYYYYGFENALRILRNDKNEDYIIKSIKEEERRADDDKKLIKSKNTSVFNFGNHRFRYWVLNWAVFTFLSFLCCIISIITFFWHYTYNCSNLILCIVQLSLPTVSLILVILLSFSTKKIIKSLIHGKYSYKNYYKIWQLILRTEVSNGIKLPENIIRIKPIISNSDSNN